MSEKKQGPGKGPTNLSGARGASPVLRVKLYEDTKPEFGAECNRCGICCRSLPCVVGRYLFGDIDGTDCPALEQAAVTTCGVMRDPAKYGADSTLAARMREGLTGRCDFMANK